MTTMESVVLRGDDIELTVLPGVGARVHSLRVRGHELVRSPADAAQHVAEPFFWGGYIMAPWCNRLATGPVAVAGRTINLAPNFPDGSAIHGQVYDAAWQRTDDASFAIERDGDGWPWRYRAEIDYRLEGRHVAITQRLRNLGGEPCPA